MSEILKIGGRILDFYYRLTAYIGAAIFAGVMLLITAEVAARLFFNYSIPIVLDLGGYSLFIVTFLTSAWVLKEGGHVTVDLAVTKLKGRARRFVDTISLLIAAGLSAFLTYQAGLHTATAWARGDIIGYPLMVPRGPLLMVLPVGWFFLTVQFLIHAWVKSRPVERKDISEAASGARVKE
jgi:TRAP-type C4-dicarboxylate transport system permease small subunit